VSFCRLPTKTLRASVRHTTGDVTDGDYGDGRTTYSGIEFVVTVPNTLFIGAIRQRIANLFPPTHRLAFVASDRQRIA